MNCIENYASNDSRCRWNVLTEQLPSNDRGYTDPQTHAANNSLISFIHFRGAVITEPWPSYDRRMQTDGRDLCSMVLTSAQVS
jgi:hypothetical protein